TSRCVGAIMFILKSLPISRFLRSFLRKEVIQPQVPLRLPCYDLVPIRSFIFGACPLAVGPATSDVPPFRGLTGGVYKAQEHIHRSVADLRLLAIPPSRRRVAAFDLNWGALFGICSPSRVGLPLYAPLDRKSTRLNSSHLVISYAVFCLKKK